MDRALILQKPAIRETIDKLLGRLLRSEFRGREVQKLVRYCGEMSEDSWQAATAECWTELLALDDFRVGGLESSDLIVALCRSAVQKFAGKVRSDQRDRDYAGLREAIVRMSNPGGEKVFFCREQSKKDGLGVFYSPQSHPDQLPDLSREQLSRPIPGLAPPATAIRKSKKITSTDCAERLVWNWDVLRPEAIRFWGAFVNAHYGGRSDFVPIYALYCWIRSYFYLGDTSFTSLDDEEDGFSRLDYLADENALQPEDYLQLDEVRKLAVRFFYSLAENEVLACTILYGDIPGTLEDLANACKLGNTTAAFRLKQSVLRKISCFFASYPELTENSSLNEFFVENMLELCKKPASTSTSSSDVAVNRGENHEK